jgi:uncharacterized Zn-binding protein involved in type VI secretion
MPAVARANGTDRVLSPDGTGKKCRFPMTVTTGPATQSRVFVEGILVAVIGDPVAPHPRSGCAPDTQTLSSASSRVFAMGKAVARIGDVYGDNVITSGSFRCFSS